MLFPNSLSTDQQKDLECMVSKEEVKRAVWDCGTDKSPGPDVWWTWACLTGIKALLSPKLFQSFSMRMMQYCSGNGYDSNIDILVHVMECFYRVSGLRINLCKSKIMGIHVDADRIKSAAYKLGCLVLNTPFLYLGTKVGENMSRVHVWKEVIVKIKSRLSNWKLKTLSIGGRFTLLKRFLLGSTRSSICLYIKFPFECSHLLESIQSHFFHSHDPRSKKASWVTWNKVLTAKERGGLGVSSLYALNRGLMCKWVWPFFAYKSLLWSRVIKAIHGPDGGLIIDVRRVGNGGQYYVFGKKNVIMKAFERCIPSFLVVKNFQLDNFSRLVSTITLSSAVDRYVWSLENSGEFSVKSIRKVIDANCFPVIHSATRWVKYVPLKSNQLVELVDSVILSISNDRWVWLLDPSGEYSVSSVRTYIDDLLLPTVGSPTRWAKVVPIKINIFAWKVCLDKLPTRLNLSLRGIDIPSIVCPNCSLAGESCSHLFFSCSMTRLLWRKVARWWDFDIPEFSSYEEWITWFKSIRIPKVVKDVLEGAFYVMWWVILKFRNQVLFGNSLPRLDLLFDEIVLLSFTWCFNRCKNNIDWISWMKYPRSLSL
ncbi:RNA-directed DNA polymerase, eukaryota, reverse transcriptase zinc-binding domain protein [Tanacetum coccineum]